ncbi:plasmid replication protein, CyRepA1 family [Calothrix sp. NIES-2098]|uniref:plasmid replication protein, CyRepA1 family n=1 Tax=Calothrix sp. NIES-2098 TaxID=1954171 RepID=UPI000B5F0AD1|nr:hypothetical protein NIES2098_42150 [Calothrix sp. NIES-2098]
MSFHNSIIIDPQESPAGVEIVAQNLEGKAATLAHLRALGVAEGEEFWIKRGSKLAYRCVMGVDNFTAQATKIEGDSRIFTTKYPDGYGLFAFLASDGEEIYFIPNDVQGGIKDSNVEKIRAVYFESDKGSIQEQLDRIQAIGAEFGLTPSAVVFSGSKSLHCFYRVTGCDIETFREIQRHLIVLSNGDPNIQNPARVMRIAGFYRKSKGKHQRLLLATAAKYSAEEFKAKLASRFPLGMSRARFDDWRKQGESALTIPEEEFTPEVVVKRSQPITTVELELLESKGGFPLTQALTKSDRYLIYNGSGEGSRRPDNYKLALNLVATARFLQNEGVRFTGDIKDLLQQHGDRCNPPCPQEDIDRHLQRAYDDFKAKPSLPVDEIRARIENWIIQGEESWKVAYSRKVEETQRQLYNISPFITQTLNAQYLPEKLFDELPLGLTIIASIPGTGKTFGTRKVVADNEAGNMFSYRNSLCQQFCANTGADYVWGSGQESVEQLRKRWDSVNVWAASSIESILKFPPKPILVLEEVSKVLETMITGSTCVQFCTQIIEKFQEHLRFASRIICLDADVRALDIEYLQRLSGHTANVIHNEYRQGGWDCSFINVDGRPRSKKAIEDALMQSVLAGEKVFVVSDAKATLNKLYLRFKKSIPEDKILLIDGDRVTDKCPRVAEFLNNPAAWIEVNQPRVILGSPTIESSVSVDSHGYFNTVYGLFYGVINHQSVIQMLARLRDNNVPRKIHIPPYAKPANEGSRSPLPEKVKETLFNHHTETIQKLGLVGEIQPNQADLLRKLADILDSNSSEWSNPHMEAFAAYKAMRNHSMANLGELLRRDLKERGHTVKEVNIIAEVIPDHELKIEAKEYRQEKANEIANAAVVPLAEAAENRKDPQHTLKQEYEYQKAFWTNQLPGLELTAEFIQEFILEDKHTIRAIERRWIINNPQVIIGRDTKKVPKALEDGRQLWDVRSYAPLLELTEKLDLVSLINGCLLDGVIWTNGTEWLDEVLKKALRCKKLMTVVFGVGLHKDYDKCKLLRTILEHFGYQVKTTRERDGEKQRRVYSIDKTKSNNSMIQAIYNAVGERYQPKPTPAEERETAIQTVIAADVRDVPEYIKRWQAIASLPEQPREKPEWLRRIEADLVAV